MDFMFGLWRRRSPEASRLRALRRLYSHLGSRDAPEIRGRRLLRDWLSVEQRAQFDNFGFFEVVGCSSGKRYRIHYGVTGNVQELDQAGNPKVGLCFVPLGYLATGDVVLAQKIALETNERAALAVANRFPRMLPQPAANRRLF